MVLAHNYNCWRSFKSRRGGTTTDYDNDDNDASCVPGEPELPEQHRDSEPCRTGKKLEWLNGSIDRREDTLGEERLPLIPTPLIRGERDKRRKFFYLHRARSSARRSRGDNFFAIFHYQTLSARREPFLCRHEGDHLKGHAFIAGPSRLDPNCSTYIDEPLFYRSSLSASILIREIFVSDVEFTEWARDSQLEIC